MKNFDVISKSSRLYYPS